MELIEFRQLILEDIRVNANVEFSDVTSEFIKYITDYLTEAEEFDDFTETYFETTGKRNKRIQIDGYSFDEVDKSCIILISDFTNNDELTTITNGEIDKLYSRMEAFVEGSITGYIREKCEESSEGYNFARFIEDKQGEINKYRFYIISDRILSDRVKAKNKTELFGKAIDLNIWDISRVYDLAKSKMKKESIEIKLEEGLPCILAADCKEQEYKSYLTAIPGDLLADLYIKYGSRLLEGNVRSFLSVKGKVNKQIRATILNEPEMFFAFNNGIAATATEVICEYNDKGLVIKSLKDLQIINGGQTTASIANVVLQDKRTVSNIIVPMKLSIVNDAKAEEIVPIISKCANSQNKVDEADFFSNHPYHIRIEEYSRKVFAPAVDGNQYQTIWFYERARGQHTQEQMKLVTRSERDKFLKKNPKNQVIKKVDLAKYINTYEGLPYIVSKGAQTSMREFATRIDKTWKQSDANFNEYYYKKIISLAIIFKETEKIVSNQHWYKEIKSYRANIVTYSLAILFNHINTKFKDFNFDFKKVWSEQNIYKEFEEQMIILTKEVFDFITRDDRLTLNVTEWCKKEVCWQRAVKEKWTFKEKFLMTLSPKESEIAEMQSETKSRKADDNLSLEMEVIKLGTEYWKKLAMWGMQAKLLSPIEMDILRVACNFDKTGKVPSAKQCKILLKIKENAYQEGWNS